jgi:hypothetical protein
MPEAQPKNPADDAAPPTTATESKVAPPPPAPPSQQAAPPAPPPKTEKKEVTVGDDDDDIPTDAELIHMPRKALDRRLAKHTAAELKSRFGTDDFDAIKTKLARAEELEAKEEERRRSALSEMEKLKEDAAKSEQRALEAEARERTIQEDRVYEREDSRMARITERHVKPRYVDYTLNEMAKWMRRSFSKEEMAKVTDAQVEDWIKEFSSKEAPEVAKDYEQRISATAKEEGKKPPTAPLTNGVNATSPTPPPSGGDASQKTFAPNRPNSMTSVEAKQAAAREGYRW